MKHLILPLSIAACMTVMQGCTITISSTEPTASHSHTPLGVEGAEGEPGKSQAGISDPQTLQQQSTHAEQQHHMAQPDDKHAREKAAASTSITLSPKKESGLNAKNLLDAATAIVLGCIQHRC